MARTAAQYRDLLKSLMPLGHIWSRSKNSILHQIWYALGEELARVEARVNDLYDEKDVRTSTELLSEHEEDYGLPDEGDTISSITSERQSELESALLKVGQQFQQYYIDIAEALGYDIEIEEISPFWAGVQTAIDPCGDQNNIFWWIIWIDLDSVSYSNEVNISKLMNKITSTAPGHTHPVFRFKGAAYSRGFTRGFDSIPHFDNSWYQFGFGPGFSNGFANNVDYDGVNYIGGYSPGFCIGFDRYSGGGYTDGFTIGFSRQH